MLINVLRVEIPDLVDSVMLSKQGSAVSSYEANMDPNANHPKQITRLPKFGIIIWDWIYKAWFSTSFK